MKCLARVVALLLLVSPSLARADDEHAPPPHETTSPRWELVGTGAAVFGVSYGISAFVGLSSSNVTDVDHSGYKWMYLPVAGPFVTLSEAPLKRDEKVTVAALGVAQLAGLGLAAAGFVFPRKHASTTSAQLVPGGPNGTTGAMVVGTF